MRPAANSVWKRSPLNDSESQIRPLICKRCAEVPLNCSSHARNCKRQLKGLKNVYKRQWKAAESNSAVIIFISKIAIVILNELWLDWWLSEEIRFQIREITVYLGNIVLFCFALIAVALNVRLYFPQLFCTDQPLWHSYSTESKTPSSPSMLPWRFPLLSFIFYTFQLSSNRSRFLTLLNVMWSFLSFFGSWTPWVIRWTMA